MKSSTLSTPSPVFGSRIARRGIPACWPVRAVLAVGVALALVRPVSGQEAAFPPSDTIEVEELVVTVHGFPIPANRLSSTVTVIDRERITASGAVTVAELLRTVPGFRVARTGSFGSSTSLHVRGGESDYVQVLVDGVPVNEPGGAFDFASLTTTNVERIEVLRGPASVLYGSDAISGVVNVVTRVGRGAPRGAATVRGGTFGTLEWKATASGGVTETGGYSAALSRYTTDGILPFNNEFRNTVGSARFRISPDSITTFDLGARHGSSAFHFPTDAAGDPVDRNAVQLRDESSVSLRIDHRPISPLQLELELVAHQIDGGVDDEPDGPADTLGFFAFRSEQNVQRELAGLRAHYAVSDGTLLSAGVEAEWESEHSLNVSESEFGPARGELDARRRNLALYAQLLSELGGGFALDAGARLDENEAFGTFDTYRAGLVFRPRAGTRLRASFGTAFKEPTFLENFSSGFVRGNPDLEPERARTWEIGVEHDLLPERLSLTLIGFDQRYEDLIQFTFSPPEPTDSNFFNVGRARSRGLEAMLEAGTAHLTTRASYSLVDTEVLDAGFGRGEDAAFVEGDVLLRRPRHSGNLTLAWDPEWGPDLHGELRWVGPREDRHFSTSPATRVELEAYALADIIVRWPIRLHGRRGGLSLTPTISVENLLDTTYREAVGFRTPGRRILVGATGTF